MAGSLSFLDFPAPVRERIYTHLLAPHPDENETVINYDLKWNWLENPSNTTFGGVPQIDLCRCPRQKPRPTNTKPKNHMYTRYKCHGPEVQFKGGREVLWVPSQTYANSGQINFLRPASEEELSRRPNGNILSACKTVYEEALPILYRGRNFLFITGPCPRGRYQAYATQRFFAGMSLFSRVHVTGFSLNILPHEEDCQVEDIAQAYGDLATWVRNNLPSFRNLGLNLWHSRLASTSKVFEDLLQKHDVRIDLDRGQDDGWVEEVEDAESFRAALSAAGHEMEHSGEISIRARAHIDPVAEERRKDVPLLSMPRRYRERLDRKSSNDDADEHEEQSDALLPSQNLGSGEETGDGEVP